MVILRNVSGVRPSWGAATPLTPARQYKVTRACWKASLLIELLVAMAILSSVLLPLAYSFTAERRFARAIYQRAVAVEIVDGEMEVLAASGWRAFSNGVSGYAVHANAATNLPSGKFVLTLTDEKVRLEWRPALKTHGGPVVREVRRK